jgi:bacteriocin-like protein
MIQLKLAQLSSDNSNVSTGSNNKDQSSQLSQNEMNSIYGGLDLKPAGKQIIGIVGKTAGEAVTTGLTDLIF